MSSVKTTQLDGDVSVGRNTSIGGNITIQGGGRVKGTFVIDGWLDAKNIKGSNKGIFTTAEKLREAYPRPHDGWWAIVGKSLPSPIYVGDGGEWVATGESGGNPKFEDTSGALQQAIDDAKNKANEAKKAIEDMVSSLPIVQEAGDSSTKVMSQAAVTRLIEESSQKGKVMNITSSTPYTDGNYLAKGTIGSLVGIEHDYTGRLTAAINLEAGEVLECDIPTYHYVGYAALAEVVDDKYKVLAILDGDNEDAEHKAHIFFVATHKMNVVISGRYGEGWKIVKRNLSIEEKLSLKMRRLDGQTANITSSTPYTDGNYLAKGAVGSLVGIEHDYTGRLTAAINLEAGEVLECVIPCRNYVGYAALAEVVGDKYEVLAVLDGKEENGNVTKVSYTADKKMQVVVSGRFDKGWDIVKKTPTIEQQIANLRSSKSSNQYSNESLSEGSISELNRDCEELLNVMTIQQPYVYNSANAVEFPALMIVTDEHGSTEETKRALQYADEHDVISATLSLGDTGSPLDVYGDLAKNSKKPFLLTVGNHDMSDHYTSEQQLMENWYTKEHSTKLGANFHQKENKPFYYYDIPSLANGAQKKVRVINIMEHEKFYTPSPTSTEFISDLQYQWMCEILDSCDENTYVIITKHYPMEYADANVFCEEFAPTKDYRCKTYESYSGHLAKIIDSWIHGKNVEFVNESQFTHSFAKSHKENFICYLTGHMHEDNCFTVEGYPEQVCISFACTCIDKRQLVGDLVRTQGRLEDCVTCFSYNWNTRHINLLRLGSNVTADGRNRKYISFKLPNIN